MRKRTLAATKARGWLVCLALLAAGLAHPVGRAFAQSTVGTDFGDAPAPYPTLDGVGGAHHFILVGEPVLRLGSAVTDDEADGQPDPNAAGDDDAGTDDEDGVFFPAPGVPGQDAGVVVTASAPGLLDAWVDFDGDAEWEPGEQIFTSLPLAAGANLLTFPVPPEAGASFEDEVLFARFRISTAGGLAPTGAAPDGEVEDHPFPLTREADLSIDVESLYTPGEAGRIQLYRIVIANAGPAPASGLVVQQQLPGNVHLLGVEPSSTDCHAADSLLTCRDDGPLAAGATTQLTVGVRLDPRDASTRLTQATVRHAGPDPNPVNDGMAQATNVEPLRDVESTPNPGTGNPGLITLDGPPGFSRLSVLDAAVGQRQSQQPTPGRQTVAFADVPNFGDGPANEVGVLLSDLGPNVASLLVFDGGSGAPLLDLILGAPGLIPIDVAVTPDFGGGPAAELAALLYDPIALAIRLIVVDAQSGVPLGNHVFAGRTPQGVPLDDLEEFFPLALASVEDLGGSPAPELLVAGKNPASEDVSVFAVDAATGALVNTADLGPGTFPLGLQAIPDILGPPGSDFALLGFDTADDVSRAAVRDAAAGGAAGPSVSFDPGLLPTGFDSVPSFADTAAAELAVFGRSGPDAMCEVRDAASGALVGGPDVAPGLTALDMATVPDHADGPAGELALFTVNGAPRIMQRDAQTKALVLDTSPGGFNCPCFTAADLAGQPSQSHCIALNAWAGFYTEYFAWPLFNARLWSNFCWAQFFGTNQAVLLPLTPPQLLECRQLMVAAANDAGVTCQVF